MKVKKWLYIGCGCFCMCLGTLGTMVPLLPTVPLYMLATFFFARSSKKINDWFTGTKLYKENLESYMKKGGMTQRVNIRIMITVTVSMGIGFVMGDNPWGRSIMLFVWGCLMCFFIFGIKTLTEEEARSIEEGE